MRILCLDVGDRKIGMALSDPSASIAQGLKLYRRGSLEEDLAEIASVARDHSVGVVVVGLPKNLDGTVGKRAQDIIDFADAIRLRLSLPVTLWDERFSTNEAHRIFDMAQVKQKKRKQFVDVMAAQIILQGYLDGRGDR
jgi:putative Holliday junction resolvase